MPRPKPNMTYAQMGMAALLPGMQHMLELMQAHLDDFKQQLAELQEPGHRPVGRPPGSTRAAGARGAWAGMTAEERNVEMKRRRDVARGLAKGKPRRNPVKDSALSLERKQQWAALSPKERKRRLAAMRAGKEKQTQTVKLAEAS